MTDVLASILNLGPPKRATYGTLLELDETLCKLGYHPLSTWWRSEAKRFYDHPTALTWAARVGRGGAKSTAICKIALNEVLNGSWNVPPGECHVVAIVSENVEEARNRIRLLVDYLRSLGIKHTKNGGTIEIPSLRLGFKVLACRIGGVSGFRAIGRAADEVAKWNDEGTDPSEEVVASMAAMAVTHKRARSLLFSSPMGRFGLHYEAVERGNTADQIVSVAPSWIANPDAITEEQTHKLEPNERIWKREYAAVPQSAVTAVFDSGLIDRCYAGAKEKDSAVGEQIMLIDASRGGDSFAWARASLVYSSLGRKSVRIHEASETPPVADEADFTATAVEHIVSKCREHGITQVCADQYEAGALAMIFSSKGIAFWEHTWTSGSKKTAVDSVERWMRDGTLLLAECAKQRKQLEEYSERILKSGEISYSGRGAHDDYAQIVLLCAAAFEANRFPYVDEPVAKLKSGTPEYWRSKEQEWEAAASRRLIEKQRQQEEDF